MPGPRLSLDEREEITPVMATRGLRQRAARDAVLGPQDRHGLAP